MVYAVGVQVVLFHLRGNNSCDHGTSRVLSAWRELTHSCDQGKRRAVTFGGGGDQFTRVTMVQVELSHLVGGINHSSDYDTRRAVSLGRGNNSFV